MVLFIGQKGRPLEFIEVVTGAITRSVLGWYWDLYPDADPYAYLVALGADAPRGLMPLRPQARMHLGRGGVLVLLGLVPYPLWLKTVVEDLSHVSVL